MFPKLSFANIHKYHIPVPVSFLIVSPLSNFSVNVFSSGGVVDCVHWYFKLFSSICIPSVVGIVIVVLCSFLYVVLPFVPKLIVGPSFVSLNIPYATGVAVFPAWSLKFCPCTCK